jgi:subtilisin family serine protease
MKGKRIFQIILVLILLSLLLFLTGNLVEETGRVIHDESQDYAKETKIKSNSNKYLDPLSIAQKQYENSVPGQIIVKFTSDKAIDDKKNKEINKKYKIKKIEKLFWRSKVKDKSKDKQKKLPKEKLDRIVNLKGGFDRTYILTFPSSVDIEKIIKEYEENPNVEYAEPNIIITANAKPIKDKTEIPTLQSDLGGEGDFSALSTPVICKDGDINKDGNVDGTDLSILASKFGDTDCCGSCGLSNLCHRCEDYACMDFECVNGENNWCNGADINKGGNVDGTDLSLLAFVFGKGEPTGPCQEGGPIIDPYYLSSDSWGQSYPDQWDMRLIQMAEAQSHATGEGVIVAVIDSGVDYNHPELQGNIWVNEDEIPNNFIDDDDNGYTDDYYGYDFATSCFFGVCGSDSDPFDEHGHGTHCSGTIAAAINEIGMIGIAPNAKIMAVKGLDEYGSGSIAGLANAVLYAVDNGADVTSNSWAGSGTSSTLESVFDYAWANGVVSIAAAGNDDTNVMGSTPANIDSVIAVAATTEEDKRTYFSNYGDKVEISAPGGSENKWESIDNPGSSGGSYSRGTGWYAYTNFVYDSAQASYDITFYTNQGPDNANLDYWVYNVTWDENKERWLIDAILDSGTINSNSEVPQYHVPYTINVQQSGEIMVGLRKQSKEGHLDIDSFYVNGVTYEENSPEVSLRDFSRQGILSLRAANTDMYDAIYFSKPEYYNPIYPPGLMVVPEFDQDGILYRAQGTSMACPHVSGVAALMLSYFDGATNNFVRNGLRYSADNIDSLNPGFEGQLGYGRLNAYKSLMTAVPSIDFPENGGSAEGIVTISGSAYGPDFKEYQLYYYPKGDVSAKTPLDDLKTSQVFNDILGTWDVSTIKGIYILRLELITQDGTLRIDEKEVLVNPIKIKVLKEGVPISDIEVRSYDNVNDPLSTTTTNLNGIAYFSFDDGIQVNYKVTYDFITSESGLITTPIGYDFNLLPSHITGKKDGLDANGLRIIPYKDSSDMGLKITNSSGDAVLYMDEGMNVVFEASCSDCTPQSSSEFTTPINYDFEFVSSKVSVTSEDIPLASLPVFAYNSSDNKVADDFTNDSGIAEFYSKQGSLIYYGATYNNLELTTSLELTPHDVSITFAQETPVYFLDNGVPVYPKYIRAYNSSGQMIAKVPTSSDGKADFSLIEPYVRFKASDTIDYFTPIVSTSNTIIIDKSTYSQGYLTGKIRDSVGEPLSYGYVYVYTLPDNVLYDSDFANSVGDYEIDLRGIIGEEYLLNVTRSGYIPHSQTQELTSGQNYIIDFSLNK